MTRRRRRPHINLQQRTLILEAPGVPALELPLDEGTEGGAGASGTMCPARVCGDNVSGLDCGEAAATFLSEFLGVEARLVRQPRGGAKPQRSCRLGANEALGFANESQFLIVSEESMVGGLTSPHCPCMRPHRFGRTR